MFQNNVNHIGQQYGKGAKNARHGTCKESFAYFRVLEKRRKI